MPALLNSTSAAAVSEQPARSGYVDFWQLFRLVNADQRDCNHVSSVLRRFRGTQAWSGVSGVL